MSKTIGAESFKTAQLGSMKSKSTKDKIGNIKKSGPIKATVITDKPRMSNYEYMSNKNKYAGSVHKKLNKPPSREKRPHSSTFGGYNQQKGIDMYSKMLNGSQKVKTKNTTKPAKEASKKKVNKRVRSASPGGLKNYLSQKQPSYASKNKPQRVIGGNLYHPTMTAFGEGH